MVWSIVNGKLILFGVHETQPAVDHLCDRDLDVVELWSGVGSVAKAGRMGNRTCAEFDIDRWPGITDVAGPGQEDILTEFGFRKALHLTQRLRPGGLLWLAPLCSSFAFPDSSRCQRKKGDFDGNQVAAQTYTLLQSVPVKVTRKHKT
jgi:hypothetical protein